MSIYQPHDHFTRYSLADLDLVASLFRKFMSALEQKDFDLDKLRGEPESFIDQGLGELITDMLFSAPFRDHEASISLLLEHKSQGAARAGGANLPFQLRRGEIAVMEKGQRNHPKGLFPIVRLIGLYHGKGSYSGPKTVGEKMAGPPSAIPKRWKDEDMLLIDLSSYSDEELAEHGKLGIFLLVLKHIYDKDVHETVRKLIPQMCEVEKLNDGKDFLTAVFTYLFEASGAENRQKIEEIALQSLSEETGGDIMTIAEQLRKEGAAKKNEEVALKMLEQGVGADIIQSCTGMSMEDLGHLQSRKAS